MTVKCLKCGYIDEKRSITPKGYVTPYFGGGSAIAVCRKCKGAVIKVD